MTVCESDSTQNAVEDKHRPNSTTNSATVVAKPTSTVDLDHNDVNIALHSRPLRAKRKSISTQGYNDIESDIGKIDVSCLPALDRGRGDSIQVSMQGSFAHSWEDRGTTAKQLRLTVDLGRKLRSSSSSSSLCSSSSSSTSPHPANCTNQTVFRHPSPPSSHTSGSNGSLADEMDLDTHASSPSTASADMDVTSLSDTLDLSILEEDSLVGQVCDLSSSLVPSPPLQYPGLSLSYSSTDSQTQTQRRLLDDARAGKKVNRMQRRSAPPILPAELLIKVFEFLAGYQSDLCSAALVSVDWNLCATGQLYRYPEFANTIHWAMFIQTLCKSKEDEVKRPVTSNRRYRPPILTPTCLSPHLGDHPPIQPVLGQTMTYGSKPQQRRQDRLDRILGEYVRGIDLSRKAIGASRFCPCGRPYGPPISMNECGVCPRPGKTPCKSIGVFHIPPGASTPTVRTEQGTTSTEGPGIGGEDDSEDFEDDEIGDLDSFTGRQIHVRPTPTVVSGPLTRSQRSSSTDSGWEPSDEAGASAPTDALSSYSARSLLELTDVSLPPTPASRRIPFPRTLYRTNSSSTSSITALHPTTGSGGLVRTRQNTDTNGATPLLNFRPTTVRADFSGTAGSSRLTVANKAPSITIDKDSHATRRPLTITVSSLIQMARHCPNLEWLCMASAALADDTLYLETGDYMSTLQPGPRTGLTNVQVTVMDGIEALGKYCPNLGRVWLVGCDWVTHREVLALTKSCGRLQMLDARNCPRLEGRFSRLYVVLESHEADGEEKAATDPKSDQEEEASPEGSEIRNERVAIPLEFETAPTTVLLGANIPGRGVRDGALHDLFYWVYITAFVGTAADSATAAAIITLTSVAGLTTTPTSTAALAAPTLSTISSQTVNDTLALLSSVPLPREAPSDPLAFQEWFKAIQGLDLVMYKPLRRLQDRYHICAPIIGQSLQSSILRIAGYSSSSSRNNSSHVGNSNHNHSNINDVGQRNQHVIHTSGDGSGGDGDEDTDAGTSGENLAELDD
ncbi:hypothetical protein EC991_008907 [Linnemannia zychae]|nr:hypothetical protein EC991_008907 [Linnemannia zychae]